MTMEAKSTDTHRAEEQARAQLAGIRTLVKELDVCDDAARDTHDESKREAAEQAIQEDPLSVEVRSDWHTPGEKGAADQEFRILLCTGGPAVRLIGTLNEYGEPDSVQLEYQDWFTEWERYCLDADEEATCLAYAQQFYYGEGSR